MRTEHESRIFVGLTIAPAKGAWFDVISIEDYDAAFTEIGKLAALGGEVEVTDSEGALPFHAMGRDEIDDALVWLSTDGRYACAELIRAAYGYDARNYREICERASGPWKSGEEWAEQLAEDLEYVSRLEGNPLAHHIDFESFARELCCDSYIHFDTDVGHFYVERGY